MCRAVAVITEVPPISGMAATLHLSVAPMISLDKAERLIQMAVAEFAPEWEMVGDCTELTVREPDDWMSGAGSYGVTLRNRATGALKLVGKRRASHGTAECSRCSRSTEN